MLSGKGPEEWEPSFSYKGFRYVEVQGMIGRPSAKTLVALVAHTNLTQTGTFHSSSDLLNKIQQASLNSLSNNMHGLQSDTPTYEKNGWTGDAQASSLAAILNFDVARFWSKWMNDVQDSQSDRGEIPEIVPSTPFYGYENTPGWDQTWGPTPSWDAMAIILQTRCIATTAIPESLRTFIRPRKRLVDYTATYINSANGFTYNHNLGEYAAAEPPMSTMPVIPAIRRGSPRTTAEMISYFMTHRPVTAAGTVDATAVAYFYLMLTKVAETETLLGKASESARHRELAEDVKTAYNARYWDSVRQRYRSLDENGHEREYSETQNVLPVAFGMVPRASAARVVAQINDDIITRSTTSVAASCARYILSMERLRLHRHSLSRSVSNYKTKLGLVG